MIWTPERNAAQGRLVADLYRQASGVPCDRAAVMIGGLPGADKASALASARVDRAAYFTVCVGAILEAMAVRDLIPRVDGLSPMDAADFAHGEAQFLAKRLGLRAVADGRNVLWDISMASRTSMVSWLGAMKSAGYSINGMFVDISIEESVRRSAIAHRRGHEAYCQGIGYGGRYIPATAIRALADVPGGRADEAAAQSDTPESHLACDTTVADVIASYRAGELSISELAERFRERLWPSIPPVCLPSMLATAVAVDDPQPYVPGSFDDVIFACDLGHLSDADFATLAQAAARL